jgi:hypothetical protein
MEVYKISEKHLETKRACLPAHPVKTSVVAFWVMTSCGQLGGYKRYLHLQGRIFLQTSVFIDQTIRCHSPENHSMYHYASRLNTSNITRFIGYVSNIGTLRLVNYVLFVDCRMIMNGARGCYLYF